jgi:hypothetical protein
MRGASSAVAATAEAVACGRRSKFVAKSITRVRDQITCTLLADLAETGQNRQNGNTILESYPVRGQNLNALKPCQIVSLLDMIDFEAGAFIGVVNRLISIRKDLESRVPETLSDDEKAAMEIHLVQAGAVCERYGIDVSYYTERVTRKLERPDEFTYSIASAVDGVKHSIFEKLRNRKFLYMPAEDADYYGQADLFGDQIKSRFAKANEEVTQAGNCYATGNYTACVFHLMRAVEIGARKMVFALKVQSELNGKPVGLCEWGDLIRAIEKGVQNLSSGTRKSVAKKTTFEFYNHALGQFRNFKDAWRNNVSHTRTTYQAGFTKDIMDNTRQFMQHLATRLKE